MEKLTIDQVARLAFVSRSVVSRVLNDHPKVSTEARQRVMDVIKKYNYRPNSVARSLSTDRSFEICILAPRRCREALVSWIWPLLHLGISDQCIRRGYFVSLSMISADMEQEINDRILRAHAFDGYILVTQEVTGLVVPSLRAREVPTVLIGHDPAFPDFSSIDVDNFVGAYEATRHLIELGHQCVAALLGNNHMQETFDRRSGYVRAIQEAGLALADDLMLTGDYSQKSGYEITQQLLQRDLPPTAIFCGSDSIAAGCLLALYQAKLLVPDDVSVVGFDDLPGSRYTSPPLTTVRQPTYEKGQRAADILIDQIEGRSEAVVHVQLRPELIVRNTSAAPPVHA